MSVAITMSVLAWTNLKKVDAEKLAYKQKELICALIVIESNGDREAVGDGGRAYGYMKRYAKDAWTDLKSFDAEKVARIHNGGPRGYKKKATEKYWTKVKKVIEKSRRCTACDAILDASNKRSFFYNPDGSQCPDCHEQRMREKYLYD